MRRFSLPLVVVALLDGNREAAVLLPVLCALRGSTPVAFGPCVSSDIALFRPCLRSAGLPGGDVGVGPLSCSPTAFSPVGRAVPPRSGRLLGRSLERKLVTLVTDLERLLRLAASEAEGEAWAPSSWQIRELVMLPDVVVGVVVRRDDGELVPGRPPRIGIEAMAAVLSLAKHLILVRVMNRFPPGTDARRAFPTLGRGRTVKQSKLVSPSHPFHGNGEGSCPGQASTNKCRHRAY
ncbi:uncharacterized protein B0T15DRAFT_527618 [Chaetomium strumarium]|uniref:Secreted protein n=1 Tax=Chaetomium strumarium TaxID=1170767 RepID=A0AAJ0GV10_9PEZI|nr:hypothetical protein B0T15DRAFT_527618 [Chaetomium strumarium]